MNADAFDLALLGQSTAGGAGFLSSVDAPGIYDGSLVQVSTSLVQPDTHSAFATEMDNPATQPLASKQIQVWFSSDNGLDLLPVGFSFDNAHPIDLYRIDLGMGALSDTLNPGEGSFDIIEAFFVTFDAQGNQQAAYNLINGQPAGTTGATDLFDAAIFPLAGDGITDVAMIWNITPEPGSLAILALGGVAVVRRARRFR